MIEAASGPGPNAKREPSALTFDTDALDHWDEVMRRDLGLELVGMWHVQPGGDDQPSETDDYRVRSLLFEREEQGAKTARALELILTPAPGGGWTMHPWIVYLTKKPGLARPARVAAPAEPAVMRETR